jgi:hypothetical protein
MNNEIIGPKNNTLIINIFQGTLMNKVDYWLILDEVNVFK